MAWEAWAEGGRAQHTTNLDHSAGYFGDIEAMSVSTLPNDDHGNPAIVLDHENHLHSFYGCHGNTIGSTGMQHSSTRWPVDEIGDGGSKWTIRPQITGSYTYPNPFMVGSTMHLVMRKTIRAQTRHPLVRYATSALADGVATWGSEITIVDFGADSRVYAGNGILIGTDWHFCCTKADNKDTIRVNVYCFILDTTTGDIKNHDGSVTIAAADLPVDLTESDADFRLFTHSGGNGGYIVLRITRLSLGSFGDAAPVGEGVSELRIHCGSGYRVYFVRRGAGLVVLLGGGDKSSQKVDIAAAKAMAKESEE